MPVVFPTAGFFLYFCIYQCDSMVGLVVVGNFPGVEEREIPSYRFNLFSVTPNPFIGSTTIRYSLPTESPVKMEVYDVVGRRVKTLRIFLEEAGEKEVEWDGRDERGQRLNTGIYFIRMETFGFQSVQKVILLQ